MLLEGYHGYLLCGITGGIRARLRFPVLEHPAVSYPRGPILVVYFITRCAYMQSYHRNIATPQGEIDSMPLSPSNRRHTSRTTLFPTFSCYLWYQRTSFQRCASSVLVRVSAILRPIDCTFQNPSKGLDGCAWISDHSDHIDLQSNIPGFNALCNASLDYLPAYWRTS